MRIENIRLEKAGSRIRSAADIIWENNDRPRQAVWFEVDIEHEAFLSGSANSFFVGAAIPAFCLGEQRITLGAPICPELKQNLGIACRILSNWYHYKRSPLEIEADVQTSLPLVSEQRSVGIFLSGGIDSSASLRANRLQVPRSHPSSVTHGVLVFGYDIGAFEGGVTNADHKRFELALKSAQAIAKDTGLELVSIYTNIRHLKDDVDFWVGYYFGAFLSAVSHQLDQKLRTMIISSGPDITTTDYAHGSHPLLDPYYGSALMKIAHHGIEYSRLDKTRIVADWPTGIANLRVCTNSGYADSLNCGACEKCLRTMLALHALGRLSGCGIFLQQEIDSDLLLKRAVIDTPYQAFCYRECLPLLDSSKDRRLIEAIRTALGVYERSKRNPWLKWADTRRLRSLAWELDRDYAKGIVYQTYRKVTNKS